MLTPKKKRSRVQISLKPRPGLTENLMMIIGTVMVWRGLWNMVDTYLFPQSEHWSNIISIAIGLFLVYLPDRNSSPFA